MKRSDGEHRIAVDVRNDPDVWIVPDDSEALHDDVNTSRYYRRSASLPQLGESAEHELVDDMEALRKTAVDRRRR